MSTIIDTPDGIKFYQLCVHIFRLRIEINTGLGSSVSTLKSAQQKYGHLIPGGPPARKVEMMEALEILKERVIAGEVAL